MKEKISVVVRFRPHSSAAAADPFSSSGGGEHEWRIESESRVSLVNNSTGSIPSSSFAFDRVFDGATTNERVYVSVVRALIHAAVSGLNGTAFTYGQTSSGKTYTMKGTDTDPGIIHRAVHDVFDITQQADDRNFLIKVSYMEIYIDQINDLLSTEKKNVVLHEDVNVGVLVQGLREETVNSAEEVMKLFHQGEGRRHFGDTQMNARSSRAHAIFRMVIESNGKNEMDSREATCVSVLNLVDLAGSENTRHTGAQGVRLTEAQHINTNLTALGNVIEKLSEIHKESEGKKKRKKKSVHVPFRNSKLTRILQPALEGNGKTLIICTASPEKAYLDQTRNTLLFGSRAKCIRICPTINEIRTDRAQTKRQRLGIGELHTMQKVSNSEDLQQDVRDLKDAMQKVVQQLDEEVKARQLLEQRMEKFEALSAEHLADSTELEDSQLEKECKMLRDENSALRQEVSRSKLIVDCWAAEKMELQGKLDVATCALAERELQLERLYSELNSCTTTL